MSLINRLIMIGAARARAAASPAPRGEVAWGGARITGGIVQEEHNADLRGKLGLQAAAKMRRTDAQVRAVEKVLSLPIRSTVWLVEEPDGAGSAEREAAALLRENLFGGMEHSWDDLLREACLAIYYGFRVPEIVWEERDGLVRVRKVAGRNGELVERWLYDDAGCLVGYLYVGNRPVGEGLTDGTNLPTRYERIPVPLEKTLHFVYDGENDNPQGFGLWRSMYPHWYIKQALYKIMGIGIERNLLGVPYGKLQAGAQDEDKRSLLTILSRLRAADDGAFVLGDGQSVDWFESTRSLVDAMPFLQHQDAKIAQAGLAQFLNLGQTGTGTQALGTVHARLFETAEDANARWIAETINSQLVRRWVRLNYGEGLRPPRVRHKPIKSQDLAAWAQALSQFVTGGLVHPGRDDEEYVRDTLELPPIPDDQGAINESPAAASEKATAMP